MTETGKNNGKAPQMREIAGKALKFDGEALNIDGEVLMLWASVPDIVKFWDCSPRPGPDIFGIDYMR